MFVCQTLAKTLTNVSVTANKHTQTQITTSTHTHTHTHTADLQTATCLKWTRARRHACVLLHNYEALCLSNQTSTHTQVRARLCALHAHSLASPSATNRSRALSLYLQASREKIPTLEKRDKSIGPTATMYVRLLSRTHVGAFRGDHVCSRDHCWRDSPLGSGVVRRATGAATVSCEVFFVEVLKNNFTRLS